jgi:outer membrane immunogenic protein
MVAPSVCRASSAASEGGCNYQFGAWVIGFEGDGSATNKSGQSSNSAGTVWNTATGPVVLGNSFQEMQERWLVTARGKLGWTVWDKTMIYVTGGGAWAKIDSSSFFGNLAFGARGGLQSDTRSGWTVGAGAEYALGYGWSVKGEYLYVDFGSWTTFSQCPTATNGCLVGGSTNESVNLKDHIFRAGMNYRFW